MLLLKIKNIDDEKNMRIFVAITIGLLLPLQVLLADSLMTAAKRGDLTAVTNYIEKGISPNQLDPDDWRETPPLFAAIKARHTKVANYLIEQGADCKALDFSEKNALVYVAQYDQTELVSALVKCGADIEFIGIDSSQRTPLVWAVISGHELTAIELVKHGANIDVTWIHPINDTSHQLVDTAREKAMINLLKKSQ